MVLKDNPAFQNQTANRRKAITRIHNLQDDLISNLVDNQVYGNVDSLKFQSTVESTVNEALLNDRKRVFKSNDNRWINTAVENNSKAYSEILTNRLNIESSKLSVRIEEEARKNKYNRLSEAEIKSRLTSKYKDTAKKRTANIIRDALHTNESNISFIHALENGFNYKVWMNGRGKGKTRAWHRARFISSVGIDEYFDIYGSYHAQLMYPGDLNGGAENVANCRCWLSYTNQKPSNYKSKGNSSSTRNTSRSKQNTGSIFSNLRNNIGSAISSTKDRIKSTVLNANRKLKSFVSRRNKKSNSVEYEEAPNSRKENSIDRLTFNKDGVVTVKEYDDFPVYRDNPFLSNKQMDIIVDKINPICKPYISEITLKKPKKNSYGKYTSGSVKSGTNKIVLREVPGRHFTDYTNTIHHEVGHIIDHTAHGKKWGISNSEEWEKAFNLDKINSILTGKDLNKNEYFVSDYAKREYNRYLQKKEIKKLYAEDFAVSVKRYLDPSDAKFREDFPNRCKVLKKYLGVS